MLVERMVVTLRALHRHAQEHLRRLRRGLHAILGHLVGQEVRRPVEILVPRPATPRRRHQLAGHLVVRPVVRERLAEILLHARRDRPAIADRSRPSGR